MRSILGVQVRPESVFKLFRIRNPNDGKTISELLRKADEKMYEAKEQSKVVMLESGGCGTME